MTYNFRARADLSLALRCIIKHRTRPGFPIPRPGYCVRCDGWAWLTEEQAPYSSARGMLCHECAEWNATALDECFRDVYGSTR